MASETLSSQAGEQSRRSRPSSDTPAVGQSQGLDWLPVAIGTAALVAGFGSRNKGALGTALTALAGVAAVAAVRGMQHDHNKTGSDGQSSASGGALEAERSITIGKAADELYRRWRDPETLARVMPSFATVRMIGDDRMRWNVEGPHGHAYEWDCEIVDDRPGAGVAWRSLPEASIANEGSIQFRPAPADRGTVATLRFHFDPPGGALGEDAVKILGTTPLDLAADGVLRRFKSLVETGEIPTTARQPAARADTR